LWVLDSVGDRISLGCLVGVREKPLKTQRFLLSVAVDQRRDKNNINLNYKLSTLLQIKPSLKKKIKTVPKKQFLT